MKHQVIRTAVFVASALILLTGVSAVSGQALPPNDSCDARISVTCKNDLEVGTNIGATATIAPQCGSTMPGTHVVWYSVMGNGGDIQIDTCSPATNFDTRINVYTGDCASEASLACVIANDDAAGAPPECSLGGLNRLSRVSWTSVDGTEYLIAVSGFDQLSGDFELVVSCELPVVLLRLSVE